MPDQLKNTIRKTLTEQLYPAKILELSVEEGFDYDGDPILRIQVVLEAENDKLDAKKLIGLKRHLREPLRALHVDSFPIFSFLNSSDLLPGAAA